MTFLTTRHCRINRRGHWRLALLGRARFTCSELGSAYTIHHAPLVESNRHMIKRQSKSQPTCIDVKAKLASYDRTGLLGLVQDLYAVHKDNQTFLHARLGLSEDVLKSYKQTIGPLSTAARVNPNAETRGTGLPPVSATAKMAVSQREHNSRLGGHNGIIRFLEYGCFRKLSSDRSIRIRHLGGELCPVSQAPSQ